jgi:drug/metabolite transporter (DMT)-like permease
MRRSLIFAVYVLMWSVQGLLIHGVQRYSHAKVDPTLIVTLQEFLKLIISVSLYKLSDRGNLEDVARNSSRGILYIVPGGLYAIYNTLTFVGLSFFDPSRYFILMQFRIVVTAIVYSWFFPRGSKLTMGKWFALILIMIGAMLREFGAWTDWSWSPTGYAIVGLQVLLSTTAGVSNERLLKKQKSKIKSLNLENIYMYSVSLLINLGILGFRGDVEFFPNFKLFISYFPIILNGSLLGIVTSVFLSQFDSITKSIASAVELWVTALLSSILFGYPIDDKSTVAGIGVLSIGVFLFSVPFKIKSKR